MKTILFKKYVSIHEYAEKKSLEARTNLSY